MSLALTLATKIFGLGAFLYFVSGGWLVLPPGTVLSMMGVM